MQTSLEAPEQAPETEKKPVQSETTLRRKRGPKTQRGKFWSAQNSTKHGIFVNSLLPGESEEEYKTMAADLRNFFQPPSPGKDVLIRQLVTLLWRHRRLMRAEAAEVMLGQSPEGAGSDTEWEGYRLSAKKPIVEKCGLLAVASHKNDFALIVVELHQIRGAIEEFGPNWERDRPTLLEIYSTHWPEGAPIGLLADLPRGGEPAGAIAAIYRKYMAEKKLDSDECGEALLHALEEEIARVTALWEEKKKEAERRDELRKIVALVPRGDQAKILSEYEVRLDRAINRAITVLERLQRTMKSEELRVKN